MLLSRFNSICQMTCLFTSLHLVSGLPYGPCWIAREGQGWLHGNADPLTGRLTGDEIAFVYPDLSTGRLPVKVHPKNLL